MAEPKQVPTHVADFRQSRTIRGHHGGDKSEHIRQRSAVFGETKDGSDQIFWMKDVLTPGMSRKVENGANERNRGVIVNVGRGEEIGTWNVTRGRCEGRADAATAFTQLFAI